MYYAVTNMYQASVCDYPYNESTFHLTMITLLWNYDFWVMVWDDHALSISSLTSPFLFRVHNSPSLVSFFSLCFSFSKWQNMLIYICLHFYATDYLQLCFFLIFFFLMLFLFGFVSFTPFQVLFWLAVFLRMYSF